MTDMRRTLLWGVFLISLFLLYDAWMKHTGQPSLMSPAPSRPAATAPAPAPATGTATLPSSTATPVLNAAAPATTGTAAAAAEIVEITTDLVKARLNSQGGTLEYLELLTQKQAVDKPWYEPFLALVGAGKASSVPPPNVVLFDRSSQHVYLAQSGLLGAGGLPNHLSAMKVVPGERTLREGLNTLSISFESPEQGGVKLVKTYTFHRGRYTVDVRHEIRNVGSAPVPAPQLYLQLVRDSNPLPGESSFYFTFTGPAVYTENAKFQKIEFSNIDKGNASYEKVADTGWIGMVQHYFASAWIHNAPLRREFSVRALDANQTDYGRRTYVVSEIFTLPALAPASQQLFDAVLFAGPQEEEKLETLAPGLELVKDYGWFTILAKPLFALLTWLHKLIGNWGWAIVALVVLLKIAFYWLNASAYRSMAKMKAINPKVQELRERYKDKPQQMQQEMMRIYREEKVNPLGGCLPIFVQMPFFIALYWVLLSTVEMRHAPWIGWITDLSVKDPYFILPLLMTASQMFQTWLNPTPPDPVQARMMWIMPLVFSVMFFFFPAGLVLYWLTNNILSIAQQYVINKRLGVIGK
ncbi:membrane protein insertase YidC [Piscinibacter sp. XHJ-5]|uniref:membrane protein insertase YidC n=1 Tax=Piscinibacter sp. XHJ-5 TaxID=3037797 RepID=UPI002452A3C3|nr:membrane protein insertase YidC [Piscinibacter sp. XHJ-5]